MCRGQIGLYNDFKLSNISPQIPEIQAFAQYFEFDLNQCVLIIFFVISFIHCGKLGARSLNLKIESVKAKQFCQTKTVITQTPHLPFNLSSVLWHQND
jgi:hypothetical protein